MKLNEIIAYVALGLSASRLLYNLGNSIFLMLNYNRKSGLLERKEVCRYLVNTREGAKCANIFFQNKATGGVCPLSKCGGYHPESKPTAIRSVIDILIASFPEIATLLLALIEIIG